MRWWFVVPLVILGFGALAEGPSFTRNYGEWSALSGPSRAAYPGRRPPTWPSAPREPPEARA
jgi:hypothetical protein